MKMMSSDKELEEFRKKVQAFLDSMTLEEFDQMLIEMGNETGKPGPMFKSREYFEEMRKRKNKYFDVSKQILIEF